MNVFDLDKTIYDGDSTLDFCFYCLKMHPSIISRIPGQVFEAVQYILKKLNKTKFKTSFIFLEKLDDVEKLVMDFWSFKKNMT